MILPGGRGGGQGYSLQLDLKGSGISVPTAVLLFRGGGGEQLQELGPVHHPFPLRISPDFFPLPESCFSYSLHLFDDGALS